MENIQDNDVLFGRGGATNNHIGNKKFRNIVAEHQREYLDAKKKDKATIARLVVGIIKERGGRFLRRDNTTDMWVEVTDKKATEKTSQALRENLDIRHKEFRNNKAHRRRHSGSTSSTSSYNDDDEHNHHVNKKRRYAVEGKVVMAAASPTLISEDTEGVLIPSSFDLGIPTLCYQPPPPVASDCDDFAAV